MKNFAANFICFLHLIDLTVSGGEVTGSVNGTVTLPCNYTDNGGHSPMCWGRGQCSYSGCKDEIISTDGHKVIRRKSDRYQLLGNIGQRNVSLTITGATKQDEGTYCCRVEIPGPFNDWKQEMEVKIQEENAVNPVSTGDSDTDFPTMTTVGLPMYNTSNVTDMSPVSVIPTDWRTSVTSQENKTSEISQSPPITNTVIPAVVGALLLVALIGVIFIYKYQSGKKTETQSTRSVINMEALAGIRNEAPENIYLSSEDVPPPASSVSA